MTNEETEPIKLTQYSRSAGCSCKIAPAVLDEMLKTDHATAAPAELLVGYGSRDDAAAYAIGNGQVLISTTDFFMPIVDDAFQFGQIAAANAVSDVYAMGGKPLMALAILGWPVEKLPAALARQVLEGARFTCAAAGIPLAGGHSIDATEPVFGLSVSGICTEDQLRRNDTAREGDWIMLSKPIGTGILSAANKRGLIEEQHLLEGIGLMTALNKLGLLLGAETAVTAMTDVTGFGLLGHLMEMAEGANLSAEIFYDRIPLVAGARLYLAQRIVPDATYRNWNRYSAETGFEKGVNVMEAFNLLPDPQTNGGLLFTVADEHLPRVQALLQAEGYGDFCLPIGRMTTKGNKRVQILVG